MNKKDKEIYEHAKRMLKNWDQWIPKDLRGWTVLYEIQDFILNTESPGYGGEIPLESYVELGRCHICKKKVGCDCYDYC